MYLLNLFFHNLQKVPFGANYKVNNNFLIFLRWGITVRCLEHHVYENGFTVLLLDYH